MSTFKRHKKPMRISITYILPLLLLLLLMIVALQPARAEEASSPCLAGPHSLFQGPRAEYAEKFKAQDGKLKQAAQEYLKNMADYSATRTDYQTAANTKQAAYASAQKAYYTQSEDTATAYRTAGRAHQAQTVQTHKDYMNAGCPRADLNGARDISADIKSAKE